MARVSLKLVRFGMYDQVSGQHTQHNPLVLRPVHVLSTGTQLALTGALWKWGRINWRRCASPHQGSGRCADNGTQLSLDRNGVLGPMKTSSYADRVHVVSAVTRPSLHAAKSAWETAFPTATDPCDLFYFATPTTSVATIAHTYNYRLIPFKNTLVLSQILASTNLSKQLHQLKCATVSKISETHDIFYQYSSVVTSKSFLTFQKLKRVYKKSTTTKKC